MGCVCERPLVNLNMSLVERVNANAAAEQDINLFKQFLRIKTMHPHPDLSACVQWLRGQADELGLVMNVFEYHPGLPLVVLTKVGSNPALPSIGLNCHMDVVPVEADKWTKLPAEETPFSAWEDEDGKIYARGSQDMKCVGAQYLCALRRLKSVSFLRTVHTVWVPDEEIGGVNGMKRFVRTPEFQSLHIAAMLDEGLAHTEDKFVIYYGERTSLWVKFTAKGPPGHASKLIEGTSMDRIARLMSELTTIRDQNVQRLQSDTSLHQGDVTTINITIAQGGISSDGGKSWAYNVIPSDVFIGVDIRSTYDDFYKLLDILGSLAKKYDVEVDYFAGGKELPVKHSPTIESVFYREMESSLKSWNIAMERQIFPAATDSRYVRGVGIPAYGFSPIRKVPSLLHDHNEYLPRTSFLEGVEVYCDLIQRLANIPEQAAAKL